MPDGQPNSGLGERHTGADQHDRDHERRALVPRGGVGEAVLDRIAVYGAGDQRGAPRCGDEHARELRDPVRGEDEERDQPDCASTRAAAGEGQVAAERHQRDSRGRRSLAPERARRDGNRKQQQEAERDQRRKRVPVVERPGKPSPCAGQDRGCLQRVRKQAGPQPRGKRQAPDDHDRRCDGVDRVPHRALALAIEREREYQHPEVAGHEREVLQAALGAERPGGRERRPRNEAAEQRRRPPTRFA